MFNFTHMYGDPLLAPPTVAKLEIMDMSGVNERSNNSMARAYDDGNCRV